METIDIKDLVVGSYFSYLDKITEVQSFTRTPVELAVAIHLGKAMPMRTRCTLSELSVLPITPEWLEKLGFTLLSNDPISSNYGFYGLHWNKAFGVYNYVLVPAESSQWDLLSDSHYYAAVLGVHHLQALIWHLERVWLTIQTEMEVAHE
ncbi:hypothetical protein [Spirosoma endbachense]|uniref:Uncharacterized protein n=1 Tax=Spirosoma endbachense TaxID=2666025 RepID=A0A6P1W4K7_9BACT|nr:hypothetical protein [Spirosoma endbachense]QHV99262.1 hypothetical protein GJR95_31490 [Spirosoma endbachense]